MWFVSSLLLSLTLPSGFHLRVFQTVSNAKKTRSSSRNVDSAKGSKSVGNKKQENAGVKISFEKISSVASNACKYFFFFFFFPMKG